MNYWKNILQKFPKTVAEKSKLESLERFVEHINHVLFVNKGNGISNNALVISEKQMQEAKNEIQSIKTQIRERRLKTLLIFK